MEIEEFPDELTLPSDEPFGGLFTSKTRSALIEEFIADPYHIYKPKELAELLDTTYPTLRVHFSELVRSGLIEKDARDTGRPKYRVNFKSKRLIALSILMDAINDDRDGTDSMDRSIGNYYRKSIAAKFDDVQGRVNIFNIQTGPINQMTINSQDEKYPIRITEGSA